MYLLFGTENAMKKKNTFYSMLNTLFNTHFSSTTNELNFTKSIAKTLCTIFTVGSGQNRSGYGRSMRPAEDQPNSPVILCWYILQAISAKDDRPPSRRTGQHGGEREAGESEPAIS